MFRKQVFVVLMTVFVITGCKSGTGSFAGVDLEDNDQGADVVVPEVRNGETDKYVDYSLEAYQKLSEVKRVLFFHANWCPTCRAAEKDFLANESAIPDGVVVLKLDYDKETELKKKYGITYQHTFVQVDANGEILSSWSGGSVSELSKHVK